MEKKRLLLACVALLRMHVPLLGVSAFEQRSPCHFIRIFADAVYFRNKQMQVMDTSTPFNCAKQTIKLSL